MNVRMQKADSELAYPLQAAKEQQKIRQEEVQIEVVERHKLIEVEEKEIERRQTELIGTVRLPADAEAFRMQTIAEGRKSVCWMQHTVLLSWCQHILISRTKAIEEGRAAANATRAIGEARAKVTAAVGQAEAERMNMKAAAYKQYGPAAVASLVFDALPKVCAGSVWMHCHYLVEIGLFLQVAAEVSAPLVKTQEILIIAGDDRTTGEVARLAGSLPPAVESLTGMDIKKIMQKALG